jgi:hypothetical protein
MLREVSYLYTLGAATSRSTDVRKGFAFPAKSL